MRAFGAFFNQRDFMTNGAFNLEVHNPLVGRGSLLHHFTGLDGNEAAELMTQYADKVLLLRERGQPSPADHDALRTFQLRTGKRLLRF
jgi:hypothetical protein